MKRYLKTHFTTFLSVLCFTQSVNANFDSFETEECYVQDCCAQCPEQVHYRNLFFVGPEIYHMRRERGGGKQCGWLYGARIGYDRIKRYGWYLGFDALYASGRLCGHNKAHHCLKSHVTDKSIEGRAGYTFQQKYGMRAFVTPYVGFGYFVETNNFRRPSPLRVHFKTRYKYAALGFLSGLTINPCWDVGANFKAKFLVDPDCKVSHDPDYDDSALLIKERMHYRVDIPITYHPMWLQDRVRLCLVPFYEYRKFGNHPNYPFDYLETTEKLYGATLRIYYCF